MDVLNKNLFTTEGKYMVFLRMLIISSGTILLIATVLLVNKKKLTLKYGLLWLSIVTVIFFLGLKLSNKNVYIDFVEIKKIIIINYCYLILVLFLLLHMTVKYLKSKENQTILAQKTALLEFKLKKLEKIVANKKENN